MFKKHHENRNKIIAAIGITALGLIIGSQLTWNNGQLTTAVNNMPSEEMAAETLVPAYDLFVDGHYVASVPVDYVASPLERRARAAVEEMVGYVPDYDYTLEVKLSEKSAAEADGEFMVAHALEQAIYQSLDEIKVKACIMKIDDFYVTLADEASVEEVLENAQSLYVQDDSAIKVELQKDAHNSMVLTPEVNVLSKALPEERIFVSSAMTDAPMEDLEASDDLFLEAVVKDVSLEQSIVVIETYVSEDEITDVATATELITKEHEKEKVYTVKKGDSPSVIAVENSMSTKELYALNPGLKENARRMQIGDELVVMVPEPELFVTTQEDVIYTEVIDREQIFVNNPDEYIGTYTVIEEGYDGVLEVRASVEKLNGTIMDQEIMETTVLLKPKTETLYRGTKALPVTTATGTFEMPMLTYTYTSGFGYRWGRLHKGIDLAAPVGTAIKASDGGRVIQAGWDGGYGYAIEIDHGKGLTTKYAHCSALYVSVGEEVGQYETIAAVGNTGNSTGPHLHFEIRKNGTARDPMIYLK